MREISTHQDTAVSTAVSSSNNYTLPYLTPYLVGSGDVILPTDPHSRSLRAVCVRRARAGASLGEPCGLCCRQRAGSALAASPAQRRRRLAAADNEVDDAALLRRFGALLQAATGRKKLMPPARRRWAGALLLHRRLALAPCTPASRKSQAARPATAQPAQHSSRTMGRSARASAARQDLVHASASALLRHREMLPGSPKLLRRREIRVVFTSKKIRIFISVLQVCLTNLILDPPPCVTFIMLGR